MTNKSGLRYKFKITYNDGADQEITTSPIDAVRWEKANAGKAFQEQLDITRMMWIAWAAGRRQQILTAEGDRDFEKWVERINDFDADEDVEPDPTSPDRSESSTPDSPSEPAALPAT